MLNNHLLSRAGNFIKLSNSLGVTWCLSDFVAEKIATKTPKHKDYTKTKKSKYLYLMTLPVRDKTNDEFQQYDI